jgi:hypothetical protein
MGYFFLSPALPPDPWRGVVGGNRKDGSVEKDSGSEVRLISSIYKTSFLLWDFN